MANELLNIRVPPVELEALRIAAAANGKTLQREALDRLKRSLFSEPQDDVVASLTYLFSDIASSASLMSDPKHHRAEFLGTVKEAVCRILQNLGAGAPNTLAVDVLASQTILSLRQPLKEERPEWTNIRQALGTGSDLKAKGTPPDA